MNWYLLQTKPHGHVTACEHLRRQGFDVFLPLTIKTVKDNGKFVNKTAPLFPGYLFMGTSTKLVPWQSVNGTRGISRAVTLDGIYRPISTRVIEGLKYRCDKNCIIQSMDEVISGDRVKIERGPFTEFICTVDQVKSSHRAWVLIDLLQQQVRAEFSLNKLSKTN
ncbi:MAG: transcription termination/antitermination protein NusG [Paracoccaceae bacterium]